MVKTHLAEESVSAAAKIAMLGNPTLLAIR